jgi:peroxiredoxin Q/BCP
VSQEISEGAPAPDFNAACDGGGMFKLSSLKGKNVVLYFYPKDDTPGCTKESCEFAQFEQRFSDRNAEIVGVSKDSVARHDNFKSKYNLPFTLVSDEDGAICEDYGVWQEKKNYGRTYMGISRSTFLIDADGKVAKIWRKVRVTGHVEAVMTALDEL